MRKSDRIRQLEIQVAKMETWIEVMTVSLSNLIDSQQMVHDDVDLDSGKWYKRPPTDS